MKKWPRLHLLLALSLLLTLTTPALAATSGMENFKATAQYTVGQFRDVPERIWYEEAMGRCVAYGLMSGTTALDFAPTSSLTLAQALVMAARVHKIYSTGDGTLAKGTPWYQSALDYALEHEMVRAGEFDDYERPATRGEMAALFARSLPVSELKAVNTVTALPDVTGDTPYREEIFTLYRAGVVAGGNISGSYYPTAAISRGEAAAIIARVVFPELRKSLELFTAADLNMSATVLAAKDGSAQGSLKDRMHSRFFDFSVADAYTCDTLPGYTPEADKQLLVVRMVVENVSENDTPMYDVDFQACWDDGTKKDAAFPLEQSGLVSSQLPAHYTLAPGGIRGGVLVYEIPASAGECTIVYEEFFDDSTTGDSFFVTVTPREK